MGLSTGAALTILISQLLTPGLAEFTSSCPPPCDCTWQSADCKYKYLNQIPDKLSSEIQNLDLTGNPLYEISQAAFQSVGLSNLKKLVLKSCNISIIQDNGFSNLRILMEIDLSNNDIKVLNSDTFNATENVRSIFLNNNKIEKVIDGLFRNLLFLQMIDLSSNHIFKLGLKSFVNLPKMRDLKLWNNCLTHIKLETIDSLNLQTLDLHRNPWKCDCTLQPFRDWVVVKNLYTTSTICAEPPRLRDILWKDTDSSDFACKPSIIDPFLEYFNKSTGDDVTLSCKVVGNPIPIPNWEQNSKIIEGDTKRYGGNRFVVTRSNEDVVRWVNLTIINLKYHDSGDYTCFAENAAGLDKRVVSLTVSRTPGATGAGIGGGDLMFFVVGIIISVTIILIIIIVLYVCFCRKQDSIRYIKSDIQSPNGETERVQSLITTVNPLNKPPRIYDAQPSVMDGATEMSELNKTLLDSDSVFTANEDESRSMNFAHQQPKRSREALLGGQQSAPQSGRSDSKTDPPDLISFSQVSSSTSSAPNAFKLPNQLQMHSPVHSPIYGSTPFPYRTLPHSRSPFVSPISTPKFPRPGYITIPRRYRSPSWTSTASTVTPGLQTEYNEAIYDNLGRRTTANGNSTLSLNKIGLEQSPPMTGRPLPATPGSYHGLQPILDTAIEELEKAPSPAPSTSYSATLPRINNHYLHLPLSPSTEPQEAINRRSISTPERGALKRFTFSESSDTQSPAPSLANEKIHSSPSANDNLGRNRKTPPRPPPKPKKKNPSEADGSFFQEEGEDGTEV